jgi:hypothetical protein
MGKTLNSSNLKDIVPLVYMISTRKNWNVNSSLHENGWIAKNKMTTDLSFAHIDQFVKIWIQLQNIHLLDQSKEKNCYSVASTYKLQFLDAISSQN